jgi:hypothetical protein
MKRYGVPWYSIRTRNNANVNIYRGIDNSMSYRSPALVASLFVRGWTLRVPTRHKNQMHLVKATEVSQEEKCQLQVLAVSVSETKHASLSLLL